MEPTFLSIKEASDKYGKAEITIRRLVRSIVNDADTTERDHIQPSLTEVAALKKKRKPFSYAISTDLLDRTYNASPSASAKSSGSTDAYADVLKEANQQLQSQLGVKDDQIRALNQALDALTERQRESNILMKGLQEQFLLKTAKSKSAAVLEAKTATATAAAAKSSAKKKSAPAKKKAAWKFW